MQVRKLTFAFSMFLKIFEMAQQLCIRELHRDVVVFDSSIHLLMKLLVAML